MVIPNDTKDIIEATAKGCTKGGLEHVEEKIKLLAQRIINHEIAFIKDNETIELVKEQKQSSEYDFYLSYLEKKDLKILAQMGLSLRKLDCADEKDKLNNLKNKIVSKFFKSGLHIAQFIQNGLLKEHISMNLDKGLAKKELIYDVELLLSNLETQVTFVQQSDDARRIVNIIKARLDTNSPQSYLIFARESAYSKGLEIQELLEQEIENYLVEKRISKDKLISILIRKDLI